MDHVKLLKFPYPFQAALAICSDIDGTSWDNFVAIHQFLNSNQNTIYGKGLSLPIGDSFWMYDLQKNHNKAFSYFDNIKGKKADYAPAMRELIQAGILDVLHSYGNFTAEKDFNRKLALQAIEELDKYNLKLKVWTNHGGLDSSQNIGSQSAGKGDILVEENVADGSSFYHADLLINYGFKFFWDCERSLTSVVGQDRSANWTEAFWDSPLYSGPKKKAKSIAKGLLFLLDKIYAKVAKNNLAGWLPIDMTNSLIHKDRLRDGNTCFRFTRFGNGRMDWQDDLPLLLNNKVLEKLRDQKGFMILYLHLGDLKRKSENFPLTQPVVAAFQLLADLFHSGKLWIETTSRVLTYNFIHQNLDWEFRELATKIIIKINGINNCQFFSPLYADDLCGLSFVIPSAKDVCFLLKDNPLAIKIQKHANVQIAMLPIRQMEWPL